MLTTMNIAHDSVSVILSPKPRYVQGGHPNIFAATRTNSQVLPARILQPAGRGPARREPSDHNQDRASMDRLRTMKMAAAAGNDDEQVRIEGPTAHDPADGNDSFSSESLIFPVLLHMQTSTEPPRSEGAMDGVQRLSA